MLNISHYSFKF